VTTQPPTHRTLKCPACHKIGEFRYGGEQEYPLRVAKSVGARQTVSLWHCPNCHSTFCDRDLRDDDNVARC
jgi:phage FluMu protein Com